MTNPPQKPSARSNAFRALPRFEISIDQRALADLIAELKSLTERGSTAIGDAYARAASAFLNGKERLEDLNAERRFRRRARTKRRVRARAPRALPPKATTSTST